MKTATVGDLRNNYSKVGTLLSDGESARIERRGEPVALLTPLPEGKSLAVKATVATAAWFGDPALPPTGSAARGGVPKGKAEEGFFRGGGEEEAREVADHHAGRDGDEAVGER